MTCSLLRRPSTAMVVATIVLAVLSQAALAVPLEPVPNPAWRALRPNQVRTWYIFSDLNSQHGQVNGILDPGDKLITRFDNWWTPVSAHTQHNYDDGPYGPYNFYYRSPNPNDDMPSGPMNFASSTTPGAENYWLPREKNAVQFYMTHSQYDNNDWATFSDGMTGDAKTIVQQRNMERNGWALGWLDHELTEVYGVYQNDQTVGGKVKMDVFVHEGKLTGTYVDGNGATQATRSNPNVSMSNDINNIAQDLYTSGGQWHPPDYDDTEVGGVDKGYTWAANQLRFQHNGHDQAAFNSAVASMEISETDPFALGAGDVIVPGKRPSEIRTNEVDGHNNPYLYDDAFVQRDPNDHSLGAPFAVDTSDGGVIAGLGGYDFYDAFSPSADPNDWGEQQVIRIDFDPSVFDPYDPETNPDGGSITKVVFWDFGYAAGSNQVNPFRIELDLTDLEKFPEHRFYIAAVIPEPTTMLLLVLGGSAVLLRRRRG